MLQKFARANGFWNDKDGYKASQNLQDNKQAFHPRVCASLSIVHLHAVHVIQFCVTPSWPCADDTS